MLTTDKILKALCKNQVALQGVARELKIEETILAAYLDKLYCKSTGNLVELYIDGGARGNPGEAGAGVVVSYKKRKIGYFFYINTATNNVAEYTALLNGLKIVSKNKIGNISIYTDSELVCKQINGDYKVKNKNLLELYNKCNLLIENFSSFNITHIPREKNKEADKLVNIAINSKQDGKIELTTA